MSSAILSADDLNDFISPGVACIKPVETLPAQRPNGVDAGDATTTNPDDPYQVTTEDAVAASQAQNGTAKPAQISLTDCLACSGCVTSAEAVLISLQSHEEVLSTLDAHPSVDIESAAKQGEEGNGRVFVASVSPQACASIAATYGISHNEARCLIEQLLSGSQGLPSGGKHGSGFLWILDTRICSDICRSATIGEALGTGRGLKGGQPLQHIKRPILASSCPGWICYAEKTHPHILPHLSALKSPQAISGTLVKSILSRCYKVPPDKIWHLAIMPCFDKKLEASREELTDVYWGPGLDGKPKTRDVDCVITARELVMLAETRGISLPNLPRVPIKQPKFPDDVIGASLFADAHKSSSRPMVDEGPSGGYAYGIIQTLHRSTPGSEIRIERGRNADVIEIALVHDGRIVAKTARYYGFRNIQNLVRKLKPAKTSRLPGSKTVGAGQRTIEAGVMTDFAYIEVMACPGGCTNGGGQIKVTDIPGANGSKPGLREEKAWLAKVDEAYYSASETDDEDTDTAMADEHESKSDEEIPNIESILQHWSNIAGIGLDTLLYTTYRAVRSDVGKKRTAKSGSIEQVAGLASSLGGGW